MIISNVGTIVLSLRSTMVQTLVTEQSASLQVKLLSISNTTARLLVGPLADFVSPVFSYQRLEGFTTVRKHRVSRVVFLSGAALLLASACAWMVFGVQTRHGAWMLRSGFSFSLLYNPHVHEYNAAVLEQDSHTVQFLRFCQSFLPSSILFNMTECRS